MLSFSCLEAAASAKITTTVRVVKVIIGLLGLAAVSAAQASLPSYRASSFGLSPSETRVRGLAVPVALRAPELRLQVAEPRLVETDSLTILVLGQKVFLSADPSGIDSFPNLYAYGNLNPALFSDPYGLFGWQNVAGGLRLIGGGFETLAGYSLAAAGAGFSTTGAGAAIGVPGAILGVGVGAHGIDQMQAGARQAWSGTTVDSFTSQGLQAAGMSPNTANLTDAGISVVGSLGAGFATAGFKLSGASAQGLSSGQLYNQLETGSQALLDADFQALGGQSTTALEKFQMMQDGVNAANEPYQISTTYWQSVGKAFTPTLLSTGPSAGGAIGAGIIGAEGGLVNGMQTIAQPMPYK